MKNILPFVQTYPGHRLHENLACYNIKHSYLHIPVNSSSWGKKTFSAYDFTQTINSIPQDHTIVVFLRDPIDRWLSGLATWLTARLPEHTSLDQVRGNQAWLDAVFQIVHVDEHTTGQLYFLQGLDQDKMKFFMVNPYLSQSVCDYLNDLTGKDMKPMAYENQTTLAGGKLIPKQYFQQVLESDPKYLERVKYCFRSEYKFMKTLTYQNHTDKKFQYYDF